MARRGKPSNYFISDRSGFKIKRSKLVVEPGTGYVVARNESDGMWNLKDHPQNKPPPFRREGVPLPNLRPDINMANQADLFIYGDDPTSFIVDEQFSLIYY